MVKVDDWNPTPDDTPAPASEDSGGTTAAATTGTAGSIIDAVDESLIDNPDVGAYTVNGRTVQRRSLSELLELRRYFQQEASRARGIKQTLARFD